MTQTLQALFGPTATQTGTKITIDTNDFVAYGLSGSSPSPSQVLCAFMQRLDQYLENAVDDPTAGVSSVSFRPIPTFVSRGTATHRAQQIGLVFYKNEASINLDPDDVI
ncbi:hypothetical protein [Gloeothece verrucosa]|uniref:Uncharacterized protein n=1 Tax=Gloeothece verrucosa (strain PCC 7822) TaxID=497965 RepID=E0UJ81_GLOV7|nr:hypothetical protein [Gloeothece verrucosa]ADN15784.1 hypothetical protein Cyan7822_3852 [Gloeothece verrucosa PCC 7822]